MYFIDDQFSIHPVVREILHSKKMDLGAEGGRMAIENQGHKGDANSSTNTTSFVCEDITEEDLSDETKV